MIEELNGPIPYWSRTGYGCTNYFCIGDILAEFYIGNAMVYSDTYRSEEEVRSYFREHDEYDCVHLNQTHFYEDGSSDVSLVLLIDRPVRYRRN